MSSKKKSEINFTVEVDENNVPEKITWTAEEGGQMKTRECKSALISLWDPDEKNTMRIDLWTKEMMVDEMKHFFCQSLLTMADTFERATDEKEMAEGLRLFSKDFAERLEIIDKGRG